MTKRIITLFLVFMMVFIYKIYQLPIALLLMFTVITLTPPFQKKKNIRGYIIFILVLSISYFILLIKYGGYDKGLLKMSSLDKDIVARRHEYYSWNLGKIYRNRVGLAYFDKYMIIGSKFSKNMFSHLDLNYFFDTRYPGTFLLFPIFVLGLIYLINMGIGFNLFYFILLILLSGFMKTEGDLGYYLILPIISICSTYGMIYLQRILIDRKT